MAGCSNTGDLITWADMMRGFSTRNEPVNVPASAFAMICIHFVGVNSDGSTPLLSMFSLSSGSCGWVGLGL